MLFRSVNVAAARNKDHAVRIAAAPISDSSVNAIRIFNEHGGLTGVFRLPAEVPPPVLVVGGDFLSESPGGEFIISPRSGAGASVIVNADGVALRSLDRLLGDGARVMNIASLGTGVNHTGLIKSLRADGTWEGSVYTVPFRTAIRVEPIASSSERPAAGVTRINSAVVDGLEGGDQIEISFHARSSSARREDDRRA